jgi:DNA-binding FadR family transcriptional regulator
MGSTTRGSAQQIAGVQERATRTLRSGILSGRWPAGSRLPAERALAEELGVSRLTLRAALSSLASEGLVRSRRGSGVEVLDFRRHGSLDLFAWMLGLSSADTDTEGTLALFAEVIHLRRLVALDTLERAAARATEEDLTALDALAAEQDSRLEDPVAYVRGDHEHQRCVIRIAGSIAVELLFNSFEKVLDRHQDLELAFMGPLPEHHASYELVNAVLRNGVTPDLRVVASAALDLVEAEGMKRVRRRLAR